MDKSKWPQWMKDQYNEQIRLRMKALRNERLKDEWRCPQIWRFPLNEENVFSMLAHCFPFNYVLVRILTRFFPVNHSQNLLLSSKYLYESKHIFAGYYSDRERIVVMLNRYRVSENLDEFISWLPFFERKGSLHLIHLMIGVFFLDQYLSDLGNRTLLLVAISHLEKGKGRFRTYQAHLAFSSLIAFGHYMNQEFEDSLDYLEKDKDELHTNFGELIRRVA